MTERGASTETRSGWGDLALEYQEGVDGEKSMKKDDYEKSRRTNRILKAHRLALERETQGVQNRLNQLRLSNRTTAGGILEDDELLGAGASTLGKSPQGSPRRSLRSPRKIDETGRLCFIDKQKSSVEADYLYSMVPKKAVQARRPRKAFRGPGLASASGWGALGLSDDRNAAVTDSDIAELEKENARLESLIDGLERRKLRLKQGLEEERQMLTGLAESTEDWSERLDDILRGPSPMTRSGWGGIKEIQPTCLGSPRSSQD